VEGREVSQSISRRCGCRDESGRQLGKNCRKLASDAKHGTWTYEFRASGRKYRKGGFATKREAQQAATKLRASLDAGTYVEPSKKTLAEYAPGALKRAQVTGNGLRDTTMANYERYVHKDIVPSRLGSMLLTDIRRSHVNEWIAEKSKTRGATTVRRMLACLQTIFRTAVDDEIIPASPAMRAKKPTITKKPIEVWKPEVIQQFLARANKHRLGALYEIALDTGLRRGEITGLHWDDVDLVKRTITVRHNRVLVDGRIVQETTYPKTKAGRRTVPFSDAGERALMEWSLRQQEEAQNAQEAWRGDGHVFTMEDGRPLNPAYIDRQFTKLRSELSKLTPHGLRHTYAASVLSSGTDIAVLSKLLGHESISMTSDTYGHLVGTVAADAVNRAAALRARTTPAQSGLDA
jgi:integrase